MRHTSVFAVDLPLAVLDVIPNPVLVKNSDLQYVWVNDAFENLFSVSRDALIGKLDIEVFPDRQSSQCNGGDRRVLADGVIDEAHETVFTAEGAARETLTRKSRLTLPSGATFLVGVMHDLTEITEANSRLKKQSIAMEALANTDGLTGCFNRRALFERVGKLEDSENAAGVLILDLDHFKMVNDQFGHGVGDAVLVQFAQIVNDLIGPDDFFARLGGEEFVIYVPDTEPAALKAKGAAICKALAAKPMQVNGAEVPVTVSVGGAIAQSETLDTVLLRADRALYQVKESGRNNVAMA